MCSHSCTGRRAVGREHSPRSSSANRMGAGLKFSQPHYLQPVCQEAGDPLTDRGGEGELCQFSKINVLTTSNAPSRALTLRT